MIHVTPMQKVHLPRFICFIDIVMFLPKVIQLIQRVWYHTRQLNKISIYRVSTILRYDL